MTKRPYTAARMIDLVANSCCGAFDEEVGAVGSVINFNEDLSGKHWLIGNHTISRCPYCGTKIKEPLVLEEGKNIWLVIFRERDTFPVEEINQLYSTALRRVNVDTYVRTWLFRAFHGTPVSSADEVNSQIVTIVTTAPTFRSVAAEFLSYAIRMYVPELEGDIKSGKRITRKGLVISSRPSREPASEDNAQADV